MTSKADAPETGSVLRVLLVDDSAYVRRELADTLAGNGDIEVVGKAADGEEALRLAVQLRPDVITLDLEMPRMDGFTFLRILMAQQPTFVIVVSAYGQQGNVSKSLDLGAIDFVEKRNRGPFSEAVRRDLLKKIRHTRCLTRPAARPQPLTSTAPTTPSRVPGPRALWSPLRHLVAVSGPPLSVTGILQRIPGHLAAAMLIAVPMPDKFTGTFAARLNRWSALVVSEAAEDDLLLGGRAYLCPGGMCMEVTAAPDVGAGLKADLRIRLCRPARADRYVPSADRLFRSVAGVAGPLALAIVLADRGNDGTDGMQAILDAGGTVLVETDGFGSRGDARNLAGAGELVEHEDAGHPRLLALPSDAIHRFLAGLA